jgi:hypothetical protein
MAYAAEAPAQIFVRPEAKYFYVYMALSIVTVAFLGFAPTYWMPMAAGTFKAGSVIHIHGMIFFSWTLYFVFQSWLAASGQVARHRMVGMIGVSLATAMTIFGLLVAIASARNTAALGLAEAGRAFMIVLCGWLPHCKGLFDGLALWSGAVLCSACCCGSHDRWP